MKHIYFLTLVVLAATLFSCQKQIGFDSPIIPDDDTIPVTGGDIKGNWKFLYVDMDLKTTTEFAESGFNVKAVSSYNTRSTSNAGTIKIDATNFAGTGLSYTVNTDVKVITYFNNVKGDEVTTPLNFPVPPYNFTSPYKIVTADSIHFESSLLMNLPNADPSVPVQSPATGAKFQVKSDTLIISVRQALQQTMNQGGINMLVTNDAGLVLYLKRQ